jgi:hypothetical protein
MLSKGYGVDEIALNRIQEKQDVRGWTGIKWLRGLMSGF